MHTEETQDGELVAAKPGEVARKVVDSLQELPDSETIALEAEEEGCRRLQRAAVIWPEESAVRSEFESHEPGQV